MTGHFARHLSPDDIDAWLAGAPAPEARRHLEACSACRDLALAERELVRALAALPRLAPREDLADRVMAAVRIPDPFALRALAAAGRRLLGSRRSLAIAAGLAVVLLAAMGASAAWTLEHRGLLAALSDWATGEALRWAWVALRGAALNLLEQPGLGGLRRLVEAPALLALVSALGSLGYLSGVLALRRLLAVPGRARHAGW